MREILFRGKRIDNGEWVEGFYHYSNRINPTTKEIVKTIHWILPVGGQDAFDIIPESVGQCTSLCDKNGKKIFEGDIIVIDHTTRTHGWEDIPETYKPRRSHSVVYDDIKDHLTYKRNYAVEWKQKRARWILRNGSDQHELTDTYLFFHNGIIIGNIHDNPELLKGGER